MNGVQGILSEHEVYIDLCASYAITPNPHLLTFIRLHECGLVGHSNKRLVRDGQCWQHGGHQVDVAN
jgi:hypothetical protein